MSELFMSYCNTPMPPPAQNGMIHGQQHQVQQPQQPHHQHHQQQQQPHMQQQQHHHIHQQQHHQQQQQQQHHQNQNNLNYYMYLQSQGQVLAAGHNPLANVINGHHPAYPTPAPAHAASL
jgi:hypothetical protein